MKPGIHLTRIWSDDDMVELKVDVSDGVSAFSNKVCVGYSDFTESVALDTFKDHVTGACSTCGLVSSGQSMVFLPWNGLVLVFPKQANLLPPDAFVKGPG